DGEFSSDLLRDFCRGEGILDLFMLPASPQQNGIAERRIGLVMEVARTSMIHAAAPHFLWPFVIGYAAHQLNLWPRISLPETSPTLRLTGEVGDASVFRKIWLRRPPGFTESFPAGTQWSLQWPVYGLRQAPREWHDTLRTTLAALGFTADPSLFLRTDMSLPLFYVLVY
ncbi:unnamed protein product, partial [Closterium sp. NIES-53]